MGYEWVQNSRNQTAILKAKTVRKIRQVFHTEIWTLQSSEDVQQVEVWEGDSFYIIMTKKKYLNLSK